MARIFISASNSRAPSAKSRVLLSQKVTVLKVFDVVTSPRFQAFSNSILKDYVEGSPNVAADASISDLAFLLSVK